MLHQICDSAHRRAFFVFLHVHRTLHQVHAAAQLPTAGGQACHVLQVNTSGNKSLQKLAQPVADNLELLFEGIEVTPSTLHGDLWSGNMASVDGHPAVFDPAVYYGHSEAEFGMSWSAGFSQAFYDAYFEELPKQPGFEKRRDLYLVYHYLNHYKLFGSGYLGESERLLRRLAKAVGE
jgi:protein-ribulosamine 3-kinase